MNYHRKKQKNDKTFDSKELKKSEKKKGTEQEQV